MSKLREAWRVLIGRVDLPSNYIRCIGDLNLRIRQKEGRIYDLERDNQLARVGITDLRAKYEQLGGDAKIKAASDAITKSIIDDMTTNPNKYIPKS